MRRQEELETHDEDGEDGEGQQLETVVHQLQRREFTRRPTHTRAHTHRVVHSAADV